MTMPPEQVPPHIPIEPYDVEALTPEAMASLRLTDAPGYLKSRNEFFARQLTQLSEQLASAAVELRSPVFTYLDDPQAAGVLRLQAGALVGLAGLFEQQFELSRAVERGTIGVDEQVAQFAQELFGVSGHTPAPGTPPTPTEPTDGDEPRPPADPS